LDTTRVVITIRNISIKISQMATTTERKKRGKKLGVGVQGERKLRKDLREGSLEEVEASGASTRSAQLCTVAE
jgi:hypothetical protein